MLTLKPGWNSNLISYIISCFTSVLHNSFPPHIAQSLGLNFSSAQCDNVKVSFVFTLLHASSWHSEAVKFKELVCFCQLRKHFATVLCIFKYSNICNLFLQSTVMCHWFKPAPLCTISRNFKWIPHVPQCIWPILHFYTRREISPEQCKLIYVP